MGCNNVRAFQRSVSLEFSTRSSTDGKTMKSNENIIELLLQSRRGYAYSAASSLSEAGDSKTIQSKPREVVELIGYR